MKKIISALLSFVIILSLVACSKNIPTTTNIQSELVGSWNIAAIYYKDKLIDLDDSEELDDLYDSIYLTVNQDGSFCYMDFINYNGIIQLTNEADTYILKTQSLTKYKTENGHLIEVDDKNNDLKDYVITVLSDEMDTILLNDYDGINLHPEIDNSTFIFTKNGVATDYILQNKTHINGSLSNKSTTNDYDYYTTKSYYVTSGESNALEKAYDYLNYMAFSYSGLIKQLEYEGFSSSEAKYAADNCGADWNKQAVKKAEEYLNYSAFSRSELVDQLIYEGFTNSQAEYGVSVAY